MRRPACCGTAAVIAGVLALVGLSARNDTDLAVGQPARATAQAGSAPLSASGSSAARAPSVAHASSTGASTSAGTATGRPHPTAPSASSAASGAAGAASNTASAAAGAGTGTGSASTEGPLQLSGSAGASTNWAGYAATGARFTAATATWRQPPANCSAVGQGEVALAGFWVGLDGYSSPTVEQIGTQSDCEGATPVYYAWFELYPSRLTLLSATTHPVQAGDLLHAEVTQSRLLLEDVTAGWTELRRFSPGALAFSSAEWVAESPSSRLTGFGAVSFTSASASTAAAARQPIDGGSWTLHTIDLSGSAGAGATTGAISDGPSGSAFQVRWQRG